MPVGVAANYLEDEQSCNYAAYGMEKSFLGGIGCLTDLRFERWTIFAFNRLVIHYSKACTCSCSRYFRLKRFMLSRNGRSLAGWRYPYLCGCSEGEVVGATEYRYYPAMKVAMTDFTIIGRAGLGIGRFILKSREKDIARLAQESGTEVRGMFAEIYNPLIADYHFGGITPMNPYVRREVLSISAINGWTFPMFTRLGRKTAKPLKGLIYASCHRMITVLSLKLPSS